MNILRPILSRHLAAMLLCFCVGAAVGVPVWSQEDEYQMELGVLGGGSFYMGDANITQPFQHTSAMGGLLARYNINPRMVVKGDLVGACLEGTTVGQQNQYPDGGQATFSRGLYELSAQFEYNFFAYGTAAGYKDSHRLTPYLMAGLGATFAPGKRGAGGEATDAGMKNPLRPVFALNIPVGVGVKYKLIPRVNVGMEWTFRFTSSDRLDISNPEGLQLNDPYNIKSTGLKNKDTYSFFAAYISYDLFARKCDCND